MRGFFAGLPLPANCVISFTYYFPWLVLHYAALLYLHFAPVYTVKIHPNGRKSLIMRVSPARSCGYQPPARAGISRRMALSLLPYRRNGRPGCIFFVFTRASIARGPAPAWRRILT
ncbi:MAG: hypothetical protein LBP19_09020 [Treponema sp.]|nr:hypothetical protein [Treponema sp.]